MRRPRNISLPTQIHELVVSTYFQKFINKETLAVLLYQAMVTLLNASLNLLIITWNLLYRHCHPTSKTRPTFFSNCRISARSPKTLSSSRLMFLPYTLTYHIKKVKIYSHWKNLRPYPNDLWKEQFLFQWSTLPTDPRHCDGHAHGKFWKACHQKRPSETICLVEIYRWHFHDLVWRRR